MKISELNSLVKACSDAGVTTFRLGDLVIEFVNKNTDTDLFPLTEFTHDPKISTGSVPFDTTSKELQRYEELENLRLSDPVAFEDMVETE